MIPPPSPPHLRHLPSLTGKPVTDRDEKITESYGRPRMLLFVLPMLGPRFWLGSAALLLITVELIINDMPPIGDFKYRILIWVREANCVSRCQVVVFFSMLLAQLAVVKYVLGRFPSLRIRCQVAPGRTTLTVCGTLVLFASAVTVALSSYYSSWCCVTHYHQQAVCTALRLAVSAFDKAAVRQSG